MFFNSLTFVYFFCVVYALYLVLNHRMQNRMLLIASYLFYGWWDWRFLSLLLASTVVDYFCGLRIHASQTPSTRKRYLLLSIFFNLALLGFFKYYGFFADSLAALLSSVGLQVNPWSLSVILPVGISFYTFQTMSYSLDIYRRQLEPTHDFLDFALFVSFFPQLVAGPIERAGRLLPQISHPRTLNHQQLREGLFLIGWGMFMKVIIADNVAPVVNRIFARLPSGELAPETADLWHVMLAIYSFAVQIYCDFAGYSHIARGLAKLMGMELMVNFKLPYLAKRVTEFWAEWHISLTSWVRDYVFVSLGVSHRSKTKTNLALILTMTLIGLWHGASWNFVLWGLFCGIAQALYNLIRPILKQYVKPQSRLAKNAWLLFSMFITFHVFALSAFLFRGETLSHTAQLLQSLTRLPKPGPGFFQFLRTFAFFSTPFVVMQICQYRTGDMLFLLKQKPLIRFCFYLAALYMIAAAWLFGVDLHAGEDFIYFQF